MSEQSGITEELVRDALTHLYDNAHLCEHPLLPVLVQRHMPDPLARTQHLRDILIEAIHALKPPPPVVARSRPWRPYGILVYRYLDGMTDKEIQRELAISERQFFRDLKTGVEMLTAALQGRAARDTTEKPDVIDSSLEEMGLHLERLNLRKLVREALPLVSGLADRKGKHLHLCPPESEMIAIADAGLSRQALISTLSYAIRHAVDKVHLEILSAAQTQAILIHYLKATGEVTDDDETLALAKRLLEQQSGFLQTRDSAIGERSIALHWRRFEEPPVLIVDDNPGMLRLFSRYLAGHGYRIVCSTDGSETVRLARENNVRLVILDVMMRKLDGWAVLQQLRAEPTTSEVPILVCSVINEPELALTLGATELLKKPVTREQLLDAVARIIGI